MKDLISRQEVLNLLHALPPEEVTTKAMLIQSVKQMDAAQPERKRGKWIYGEDNPGTGRDGWFCSECEHFEMWDYSADMKSAELNLPNYCPNCGADMRGEQNDKGRR